VVTGELIGRTLASVAENRELCEVFTELYRDEGHEPYIVKVRAFVSLNEEVSFEEIMRRVRSGNQTAIGYQLQGQEPVFNPTVDPGPDERTTPPIPRRQSRAWNDHDRLIIIGDNEESPFSLAQQS